MNFFKIVHHDGFIYDCTADRVVRDADMVYVDSRVDCTWVNQKSLPAGDVLDVRKRITDFDGCWRWASHRLTYMPNRFDVASPMSS